MSAVQDGYRFVGHRIHLDRADVVVVAMKFEVAAAQCAADDLDALVHEYPAFFEGDAVVGKILAPGTNTCAETDAITGNNGERAERLGEHERLAYGHLHDR